VITFCDNCKKEINVDDVFKDQYHFYCEECFNKLNHELVKQNKINTRKKIVLIFFYLISYLMIVALSLNTGIQETNLKYLIAILNLPLLYLLFKIIFGDISTFKKALEYWIIPNLLFKGGPSGERWSAKGAEIALLLLPVLYYLIIIGEVKLIHYLTKF
jgi:hypothetical protein